jgi:hypothetical protein
MSIKEKIKEIFKPKLKLLPGTRLTSFLFIAASIAIAFGILFAANIYYNIDTGEIVMEEINRVTRVIRATGGLIVGGTATQNPAAGYGLEVATSTLFSSGNIVIASSTQELRFTGGDTYAGFKAPDNYGTTTPMVYILPAHGTNTPGSNWVLTYQSGNQLQWKPATELGLVGDISAVGNVTSGEAFTASTTAEGGQGSILWFHPNATNLGALTIDSSLAANATYTLPAVAAGTYYFPLLTGSLSPGGIMLATDNYTLGQDANNLYWDTTNKYLRLGNTGTAAELRIYSSAAGGYYLGFAATSSMTQTTRYYWPTSIPSEADGTVYILRTDSAGNLSWTTVSGAGAVTYTGTPQQGQVAIFYDTDTIMGDTGLTFNTSTAQLTIGGSLVTPLITYGAGNLTIQTTGAGNDIILDPSSDIVQLGAGTYIRTNAGYEIGRSGTQVLREMVPIMGFDLPIKTTTTTAAKISRDITSYPLNPCAAGTNRVHKLVIRYGSTGTSTIGVATTTGVDYPNSTSTLPNTGATSTGSVVIATTTIPIPTGACTTWSQGQDTDDWWVTIRLDQANTEIMIYQIFLAAFDQIQ